MSVVMPHSITVAASVTASGGLPSAGGGAHARSFSMIRLRSAISSCQ